MLFIRGVATLLLVTSTLLLFKGCQSTYPPRRIQFTACHADVPKPKAVFMTCANSRGSCEVRRGGTFTLKAIFVPRHNSSDLDSNLIWNGALPLPLPGQERDACGNFVTCPVIANRVTRFTKSLPIETYWPADSFPVKWTLTDRTEDVEILCFKFKIIMV